MGLWIAWMGLDGPTGLNANPDVYMADTGEEAAVCWAKDRSLFWERLKNAGNQPVIHVAPIDMDAEIGVQVVRQTHVTAVRVT